MKNPSSDLASISSTANNSFHRKYISSDMLSQPEVWRDLHFGTTYLNLAFCFLFRSSVLELFRTVDHCSSTVSLDSFSVVGMVARV